MDSSLFGSCWYFVLCRLRELMCVMKDISVNLSSFILADIREFVKLYKQTHFQIIFIVCTQL
uniref:Uncharacterized protein n=1 Tax=Anguilla anguilla TaxID=7936 RepID=A0A0E9UB99_ANGAN